MEEFKLKDRLIYRGQVILVAGIDDEIKDEEDGYRYLIVYETYNDLGGILKDAGTLNYATQKWFTHKNLNRCYDWARKSDLTTIEEEKQQIVDTVNEVYVRRFPSGAVRSDDRGRENPSFISPYALKYLAQHFSANAAFFNDADSAKNYFKGIKPVDIEASLMRHVVEFEFNMMPQRRDRDKVKQSLVEIMANCVMGLHQIGLEEDGLYEEPFEKLEYIKKEA